jgi:hypothetical protein
MYKVSTSSSPWIRLQLGSKLGKSTFQILIWVLSIHQKAHNFLVWGPLKACRLSIFMVFRPLRTGRLWISPGRLLWEFTFWGPTGPVPRLLKPVEVAYDLQFDFRVFCWVRLVDAVNLSIMLSRIWTLCEKSVVGPTDSFCTSLNSCAEPDSLPEPQVLYIKLHPNDVPDATAQSVFPSEVSCKKSPFDA